MHEFVANLDAFLTGFPAILKTILISALGALCACIVMVVKEAEGGPKKSPIAILGRFVVSWLAGCFFGPLVAPGVQAIVKVSENTITFISGGAGYVLFDKWNSKAIKGDESPQSPSDNPPQS